MNFDILTLFPGFFDSPLKESMLKRAIESGCVGVNVVNIRDFAAGKHAQADDRPYGGGSGMVLKVEPIVGAIRSLTSDPSAGAPHVVLLSPRGKVLTQSKARELSGLDRIALVCGHYEGVDERVIHYVDEELSIGDYVLTGGEIAALVILDTVFRLVPGVLGNAESIEEESFDRGLIEYPQYTRPPDFEGHVVPEILLSGNHGEIKRWRLDQSLRLTRTRRPDLAERLEGNSGEPFPEE